MEPSGDAPHAEGGSLPPAPAPAKRRPAWPRLWPAALGLVAAAALVPVAIRDRELGLDAAELAQVAMYLLLAVLAVRAARRGEGSQRAGWRLVAAAAIVVLVTSAAAFALAAGGQAVPAVGTFTLLVVVNGLTFTGVLVLSPPVKPAERRRLALDALIAAGSILFVVLATAERALGRGQGDAELVDLLYPAFDIAILAAVVLVALRDLHAVPLWYGAFLPAAGLMFLADVAWVAGVLPEPGLEPVVLVYLGLVAAAANLSVPWAPRARGPEPLVAQAAVYVPFGFAVVGASYDHLENGNLPTSQFFLLMVLIVLIVARTVSALRENRSLYAGFIATDSFKTQLLRFISHEIANPLSPLKLQSDMLRRGAPDPDKAWKVVDRSIARLESLSKDVRLMALAETRRIVQQTVVADLVPRIAGAVQAQQAGAAQRGIALRSDLPSAPLPVPIDGERFDQVVDNLLSNALKFTPKGGRIDVHVFRSPTGWCVLEVRDSGAGMDPSQQERLFSAFGRPQGSTTPGLGLGLYLCKAIVDGHGGRISATSEGPGRGSRFRVELPPAQSMLARAAAGPPATYTPVTHGGPGVPDTRPPDLPV